MIVDWFVDTNVVLYAASNAIEDARKKVIAREVLARPGIGLSVQVLQEFIFAARKKHLGLTEEDIDRTIDSLMDYPLLPITPELAVHGRQLSKRHKISYWDGAIIAAAKRLNCNTIFSEDLNSGQSYDGIKVLNPFNPG